MSPNPNPAPQPDADHDADHLELAADQAIEACDGDMRAALKAALVACGCLESEVKQLQAAVSSGYARGRRLELPADRKDWYD
jgi:hypothetical protein